MTETFILNNTNVKCSLTECSFTLISKFWLYIYKKGNHYNAFLTICICLDVCDMKSDAYLSYTISCCSYIPLNTCTITKLWYLLLYFILPTNILFVCTQIFVCRFNNGNYRSIPLCLMSLTVVWRVSIHRSVIVSVKHTKIPKEGQFVRRC